MQERDDMALLREYAANNSESAFEELVSRRINLVYSAALRQVRNPDQAAEITQVVFTILARKAGRMRDGTSVLGWLFKTTRFTALAQQRAAARRHHHEKEAHMQSIIDKPSTPEPVWEQLSPLLDEALAKLGESDRQAVLLRFFESKSLAEVGSELGAGEDTVRKRVSRALVKLRKYFAKRGVASTTVIIAGAISANSIQAAPAGLSATRTATCAQGSAIAASTLSLVNGTLKLMTWIKMKLACASAATLLVIAGVPIVVTLSASDSNLIVEPHELQAVPPVMELLNRCTETYDRTHTSFITRSRVRIHDRIKPPGGTEGERGKFLATECRTDGHRMKLITHKWGGSLDADHKVKKVLPENEASYHSITYDGEMRYQYGKPFDSAGGVKIKDRDARISVDVELAYANTVSVGFGYLIGDVERFDRILRKADPRKMSLRVEQFNGTLHYVIGAETRRGKYTIWLNPEKGYHFSKAEVVRKPGDLFMGDHVVDPGTSKRSVMENIAFKEVDGLWVPVKMKAKRDDTIPDGGFMKADWEVELLSIVLNPDHDALNSFSMDDIEDGARASINRSGPSYIWNKGQLIPTGKTTGVPVE